MFKHREESTLAVRRRLTQKINHSNQVGSLSAALPGNPQTTTEHHRRYRIDPGLIELVSEALCISASAEDIPLFHAIANKNKARFTDLCQAARGKKALETI